jgi:hypothetical protein
MDVAIEDHGFLTMEGYFEYGETAGAGQGLGYVIDHVFITSFLKAMGARRMKDTDGRACWVTVENCRIVKIEPLFAKDGAPFDIAAWSLKAKRGAS